MEVCETCDPETDTCSTPPHFYEYRVDEFGDVEGATPEEQEANMVAEIYHRGPISCGIEVTKELVNYTGGIFYDKTGAKNINHDISVVGFGVDAKTGEKYWIIRNSWGTYWVKKELESLSTLPLHRNISGRERLLQASSRR
jgi:cathepsin X